jgi:TnpA family transposase
LIVEQWDEILRMITTIKLGYAQASTLFNRLNSYSRQHPLYRALKELGRLFKTNFILQYLDEPSVRQSIERVLSRMENGNKFSKAITHGNNGQLIGATYREQLTAEGCKRVIANAINCYNLLYLSDLYEKCSGIAQKGALLKAILKTSTHSWEHINMVGEYNFAENESYQKFDAPTILKQIYAA